MQTVTAKDTDKYGMIAGTERNSTTTCVEKLTSDVLFSLKAVVGGYALEPESFPSLKETQPDKGDEIQLTDVIALLMKQMFAFTHRYEGRHYDCSS